MSIERIKTAAGISRGTFYAYFPGGRDELLRAAYAQISTDLVDRTQGVVRRAKNWRESIRAHADAMFDLVEDRQLGYFFNVSGPALITTGSNAALAHERAL